MTLILSLLVNLRGILMSKRRSKTAQHKPHQHRDGDVAKNITMTDEKFDGQQNIFSRLKHNNNRENIKFWIEVIGLIGLLIYVYETHHTNNLTQQSQINRGSSTYGATCIFGSRAIYFGRTVDR